MPLAPQATIVGMVVVQACMKPPKSSIQGRASWPGTQCLQLRVELLGSRILSLVVLQGWKAVVCLFMVGFVLVDGWLITI